MLESALTGMNIRKGGFNIELRRSKINIETGNFPYIPHIIDKERNVCIQKHENCGKCVVDVCEHKMYIIKIKYTRE